MGEFGGGGGRGPHPYKVVISMECPPPIISSSIMAAGGGGGNVTTVHQTALYYDNNYIFTSNVDIPVTAFDRGENNNDMAIENLKQRIYDFIDTEYANTQVFFELSASYVLIDGVSGATRKWSGSFSPQQDFALTEILNFRDHFLTTVHPMLNLLFLTQRINSLVPNSRWSVDSVSSLIVHATSLVPLNFNRLVQRGLVHQHHGRQRNFRKIKTFDLP